VDDAEIVKDNFNEFEDREFSEGEKEQLGLPNVKKLEADFEDIKQRGLKSYSFALHKAEKNLTSAHPVRMGIALNFSIYQYDYMHDYDGVVKFL